MANSNESDDATVRGSLAVWPATLPVHAATVTRSGEWFNTPFRRRLVYLLARTRGARNRCRILKLLQKQGPLNSNQIAGSLGLHYTTVQYHVTRLVRDELVATSRRDDVYGALFFLTQQMEKNADFLDEVLPDYAYQETKPVLAGGIVAGLGVALH